MTLYQYIQEARRYCLNNPDQRVGQAHFNVLRDVRPDLANQIRSTANDPFYQDARIGKFFHFLAMNWDAK